jgi:prevent-host-death family protein
LTISTQEQGKSSKIATPCRFSLSHYLQTLTVSEARANLYRIIDQAAESHQPIAITGKRANAVLLTAEDWSAIQETLYLLGVPEMRESISIFQKTSRTKNTIPL